MSILSRMIAWVEKAKYWLSRECCYDEMEEKGYASQGRCCGLMGGDSWSDYLMYTCMDCPHHTPIIGGNMKRLTEYTIPETGFTVVPEEKYKRILMDEKPSVEKVYNRLKKIEDILGDEYDLEQLRKLWFADQKGHCVVFEEHYPVVSEYYRDEDGRYIREASGVVTTEEYEAALRREQDGNTE